MDGINSELKSFLQDLDFQYNIPFEEYSIEELVDLATSKNPGILYLCEQIEREYQDFQELQDTCHQEFG